MSIARGLRLAVVLGLLATGAACGGGDDDSNEPDDSIPSTVVAGFSQTAQAQATSGPVP